ncbi:malonyl-[acyl-carrier protein] O-methyltransferase [Paenibacillus marchantiophytorum]|uniref:Malonyl-[acyl-carrier protein] O-methyltransferase n=1 Tax=Paenibacillus marchantiophytorum TaxID=1619310 RepID=A0ABQ1EQK4_9BACL|nr:malonyl-ACP O-methyltransferase BioC [Paenibacillus marchantiophytorum]GFZ81905.1 malonyl-[acyl-carrier protein] O-methyltransferase [Paenibacillus marchantiophytorum]
MSIRTLDIERQFHRSAAGSYDAHAKVQRIMAEQLASSLRVKVEGNLEPTSMLEIGCGTGTLTKMLVDEWPRASITAIDMAPGMIEAAKQRISASRLVNGGGQPDQVSFIHADVEKWSVDTQESSFDLIVSCACFQWLRAPRQTLNHLRRLLRPGGLLVFTTFGPRTFDELHQSFNQAYRDGGVEPQRHGLTFQTDTQWKNLLLDAGFSSIQQTGAIQKETYPSVRDFLLAVKAMGASASEAATATGLSSRRLFANMYKEYEERFSVQGGISATYDLIGFQAGVSQR